MTAIAVLGGVRATIPIRLSFNFGSLIAVWNGTVIAQSDATVVVEGNHYFPADSVVAEYLGPSETHSTCPWKSVASYYSLDVAGKKNPDAAWYYPDPKPVARKLKGHVAFWRGVDVLT